LLNLVNKASDRTNNSSLVSTLESANLMELCVFTHCMHCLDIAIVACLTMLLELDDVQDDVVERAAGLVGTRTSTDVFLHLALNA
jgi:hypothetical protein